MRVHNLMKDLVIQKVEEMLPVHPSFSLWAAGEQSGAKLDVVCYVLNRIPPQYVVSGRGLAYSETLDYREKLQKLADVTRLVKEGMEVVGSRRRERSQELPLETHDGKFFNFPSIIGRLLDGSNFSPAHDLSVSLLADGQLVPVIDPNWQNPYRLIANTAGTYLFWPRPVPAQPGETLRIFKFELAVEDPRFEPLHYMVELTLTAENDFVDFVNTTESYRIKDLYLFPRDDL
ncbi:MAG: late competence development ComFB family protein [Spirochaetales bacterium]|nr:late competence development ComFB family protein [Spirochaetales bacterium]